MDDLKHVFNNEEPDEIIEDKHGTAIITSYIIAFLVLCGLLSAIIGAVNKYEKKYQCRQVGAARR
jgi:hypothetical protein